jgi:hypothetical protein
MPRAKVQVAMANAVEKAGIEWPHNCLRHSFCSHAVALHGFTWTSLQADHSEKNVEGSLSGSRYEISKQTHTLPSTHKTGSDQLPQYVLVHNNSPDTFNWALASKNT